MCRLLLFTKFSKPSKNLSNNIKTLSNFKSLKYLKKLIPGMAIGSRTCKGIDAISETQVLGFFKKTDFGCDLYKSFAQSIKRNMQTKKSKPKMMNRIFSGIETNIDSEISTISIIIRPFSKWFVNLLIFIVSSSILIMRRHRGNVFFF